MKKQLLYYCSVFLLLFSIASSSLAYAAKEARVLDVAGPITPASQDFIERSIKDATAENVALIILHLDTPGGIETSIRGIDKAILAAHIPIIAYVRPAGARVASGGIFILYASQIAAMAPGTYIGVASPVNTQAVASPDATIKNKINEQNLSPHEKSIMNDRTIYIRQLAEMNGRNADWAEKAVRESASLSAETALTEHVIDVIAKDVPELLQKINGHAVKLQGSTQNLQTLDLSIKDIKPDSRYQFLSIITDPNIAYILLLIGIYGLFFEFYNPGFVLPGATGAIALLLALYSFHLLPINFVGFALLLLGVTFMIIEVLISSFGILGLAGIVAFVTGSILLLDINSPGYQIAWSLIIAMTVFTIAFFLILIRMAIRAMRAKIVSGGPALIGTEGEIIDFDAYKGTGLIKLNGEIWQVKSQTPLNKGQKARVLKITDLVLTVAALTTKTDSDLLE